MVWAALSPQLWPDSAVEWITVTGATAGAIAFVVSTYYALKVKPTVDQVGRWQTTGVTPVALVAELNAVGAKHESLRSDVERMNSEREERLRQHEMQLADHERDIKLFREAMGENRAWMQRVTEEQHDMREQIMGHVSTSVGKLAEAVHALDKTVAVLGERVESLREERER